MTKRTIMLAGLLLSFGAVWVVAETLDARELVNGRWRLEGSQTNHIGTPDEHQYNYYYKRTWALSGGTFYVDGNEYSETKIDGNVVEATDREREDWKTIRIRFLDRDTVEYTAKGENGAFGVFSVVAKGTRIKE